jgi:hypothetical protein
MAWKDPLYRHARRTRQAITTLTPVAEQATLRLEPLPPDYAPGDDLEPLSPAGAINGTSRGVRYPWDEDVEPG